MQHYRSIQLVTYGEVSIPNHIDSRLMQYEQALDKQFEKKLGMLLKLQALGREPTQSASPPDVAVRFVKLPTTKQKNQHAN